MRFTFSARTLPILKTAVESSNTNWPATIVGMLLAGAVVLRAYADQSTAKVEDDEAATSPSATERPAKNARSKNRDWRQLTRRTPVKNYEFQRP